ncbi:MAG: hypothetical protein KDD62_04615, partial [Bdellovibrionales bacterium]|nr:hypothetical protein [Bdellovibrionales bacterium]
IGTTIKNVTAAGIFLPDHEANALTFSRHYLKLMSTYIGAGLEIDSEASGIRFYRSLNTYVRDSADSAGALPRDFSKSLLGFMHKQIEACNA